MTYRIIEGDITKTRATAVIIGTFKDKEQILLFSNLPSKFEKYCLSRLEDMYFTGELSSVYVFTPNIQFTGPTQIIIIGLGNQSKFTVSTLRAAIAKGIRTAQDHYLKDVAICFQPSRYFSPFEFGRAVAEGSILGNYNFLEYKTDNREMLEKKLVQSITLYATDKSLMIELQKGIAQGQAIGESVTTIRDLINQPPSILTPRQMASFATEIGHAEPSISTTIHDASYLKQENYNALLTVSAGSDQPPYLIHLHYNPPNPYGKTVALIGKGVTFDSGGLGIKPSTAMRSMKADMAGAGTVLGVFLSLRYRLQMNDPVPFPVHGIIPATENMISGKAMRPDDIIRTKTGKTIEVAHTDAEGRLILADGLIFAQRLKPDFMIDFATLTGTAIRALGRHIAALMGNNDEFLATIRKASIKSDELVWELPLYEPYRTYLSSQIADIQNIASIDSAPDAILGGLFLKEFVSNIPWAHIDIAGPAWQEESDNALIPKGASGWGIMLVNTLFDLLSA
jgi:leucyl aminopeptidase